MKIAMPPNYRCAFPRMRFTTVPQVCVPTATSMPFFQISSLLTVNGTCSLHRMQRPSVVVIS